MYAADLHSGSILASLIPRREGADSEFIPKFDNEF